MEPNLNDIFSSDEKDILQEIMNIAFGNATADLAQVIDIYVVLSVPNIKVIDIGDLPHYIKQNIPSSENTSILQQKFWGEFRGSGILVFPQTSGKDIAGILDDQFSDDGFTLHRQKTEILLEIGNILIGACVGKVSELLGTFVTYSPPHLIVDDSEGHNNLINSFEENQTAIVMKTIFEFENKNINGFLMILTDNESIDWLRHALQNFMESYE
ncbi:MAG: chemotaxis protein CheC [Desulfobacterales bacterium]|nr:chemotaxis protein CheC [Desulfobacterales bacterium]